MTRLIADSAAFPDVFRLTEGKRSQNVMTGKECKRKVLSRRPEWDWLCWNNAIRPQPQPEGLRCTPGLEY